MSEHPFAQEREAILAANPWLAPWQETYVRATGFRGPGAKGWARRGQIVVSPSACQLPGRGYSWPGSVSDCTFRGVYLHEVGHVVHFALGRREKGALEGLRSLGGPRVTGYEPNPMETFAETFRLYAGNPALLLAGRPWRYEFLMALGINPPEDRPYSWEEGLLGDAPQRFFDQCERWIVRGRDWNRRQSTRNGQLVGGLF